MAVLVLCSPDWCVRTCSQTYVPWQPCTTCKLVQRAAGITHRHVRQPRCHAEPVLQVLAFIES